MRDPNIFEGTSKTLAAALGENEAKALTPDGNFYRTLWHEVGHYLGVDRTKDDRDLDDALQDNSNTLEEMKADLVSLFVAEALHKQGYYTDVQLKSVYAGGILRVLQNNRPRRDQPYNTMQLMQWNFYLENGLLSFDQSSKTLRIHYDKYHEVVGKMLARRWRSSLQVISRVRQVYRPVHNGTTIHGVWPRIFGAAALPIQTIQVCGAG